MRKNSLLAMAALAGFGAMALAPVQTSGATSQVSTATVANGSGHHDRAPAAPRDTRISRLAMRALSGGGFQRERRAGYGWTNAHAKRVATKKRNVKRHRAATRG